MHVDARSDGDWEAEDKFVELVVPERDRWRSARYEGSNVNAINTFFDPLNTSLVELEVETYWTSEDIKVGLTNLKRLSLGRLILPWDSPALTNLRTLSLKDVRGEYADYFKLFENCKGLEELYMERAGFDSDAWMFPFLERLYDTPAHYLPNLRKLEMIECAQVAYTFILGHVVAEKLEALHVSGGDLGNGEMSGFAFAFLMRHRKGPTLLSSILTNSISPNLEISLTDGVLTIKNGPGDDSPLNLKMRANNWRESLKIQRDSIPFHQHHLSIDFTLLEDVATTTREGMAADFLKGLPTLTSLSICVAGPHADTSSAAASGLSENILKYILGQDTLQGEAHLPKLTRLELKSFGNGNIPPGLSGLVNELVRQRRKGEGQGAGKEMSELVVSLGDGYEYTSSST